MEIRFQVQGSSPDPYIVAFIKDDEGLVATCTCAAGSVGQYCKHRLAILNGDPSAIVSGNMSDAETIAGWLAGSSISAALDALSVAERELEDAKRAVARAKKQLSQALAGR